MRATNRLIAILLGLVLTAGLILVAVEVALRRLNRNSWTALPKWANKAVYTKWHAVGTRVGFGVLAGIGLVLLFLQLWRRRPVALDLEDRPELAPATVRRRQLERALTGDASQIDGVAAARVKTKRRRVQVAARTNRLNPGDLEQRLHASIGEKVGSLGLTEQVPVAVDLEHRKAPNADTGGRVQ